MTPAFASLLDMHCETRAAELFRAYDVLVSLSASDRRLVLAAANKGETAPIAREIERYRDELGRTLAWSEARGREAKDAIT